MPNITDVQNYDYFQASNLTDGIFRLGSGITTTTQTSITSNFALLDETGVAPTSNFFISTTNSDGETEVMRVTAVSGTTLTVVRGIARGGLDFVGSASDATTHSAGQEIKIIPYAGVIQMLQDHARGELGGGLKLNARNTYTSTGISSSKIFADTTARDAFTASNGDECYVTADGKKYDYLAGSWIARESGGTFANASTTVAGKVEIATTAQSQAGTNTGETGASLSVLPSDIAKNIQNSTFTYAEDTGGDDTYEITLTPAPTDYVIGQIYNVRFMSANTGSATLNVNGLGAKIIYKYRNGSQVPLETGDILAGGMELLIKYSADDIFTVISQLATNVSDTPTVSVVAGEAIDGSTTPQAVCVVGNSQYIDFVGATDFDFPESSGVSIGYDDANTRRAVKFTTPTTGGLFGETITLPFLYLAGELVASPTDNIYIEIMTNSGSNLPSGTVITNGTSNNVAYTSIGADQHAIRFTFATPPTLTSNTTYWITVRRSSTNDTTNYYTISSTSGASGTGATYTASAGTWAATTNQLNTMLHYSLDGQGRLFKADANDLNRCNFVGFTSSNVVAGETASVQCESILTYSGLTAGKKYYLSDTAGAITNSFTGSATYPTIPVGKSLSTTKLTIDNSPRKICASDLGSVRMIESGGTAIANLDVYLPVRFGFRPSKLTVFWNASDSDAGTSSSGFKVFNLTSALSGYNLTGLENNYAVVQFTSRAALATKQAETYFGNVDFQGTIDSVFDNGVIFKLRWVNNTVNIPLISVIAEE